MGSSSIPPLIQGRYRRSRKVIKVAFFVFRIADVPSAGNGKFPFLVTPLQIAMIISRGSSDPSA